MADKKCIANPQMDCLGVIRAEELQKDLNELKKDVEEMKEDNKESHKEFYTRLQELESHNKVQDAHYQHIIEKLTEITNKLNGLNTKITEIEMKPGKKWDSVVEKVIGTIIALIIGYVFAKIGMG